MKHRTSRNRQRPRKFLAWRPIHVIAAGILAMLAASEGKAQQQQQATIAEGATLRIRHRSGVHEGTLVLLRPESLHVRLARSASAIAYRRDDVHEIDLAIPRTVGQGAVHGARMGALVGAGATIVLSSLAWRADQKSHCACPSSTPFVVGAGVVGTAITTLFGSAVGAAAPGTRWVRVEHHEDRGPSAPTRRVATEATRPNSR